MVNAETSFWTVLTGLILFVIAVVMVIKLILIIFFKKAVLTETQSLSAVTAINPLQDENLIGVLGTAVTDLRPGGTGIVNGKRYDVSTTGEFLRKDSHFRVVKLDGLRLLVEEVKG